MSSLLSIMSAGRKRNLLGGLVDWWDSGLTNGQHSGIAFTNASYSLTTDPFGGSLAYYAVAGSDTFRPGLPTAISAQNPWTVACVFYRGAGVGIYALAQSGGTSPAVLPQPDGSVFVQSWFEQAGLGTIMPAGTVSTGWHSFVTSYASGVVNFYLDGVLRATRSVSHTTSTWQPAFVYFFRLGTEARCAVGAIATRAWSLGDAISFHNSGSFKRYRDFSGFEPETNVYLARIVAAGSSISSGNLGAVNTFIAGCKADGIWNAIKASCLLAGADTLAGALIPLVGPVPTNGGGLFVSGDYSRTTGLLGGGGRRIITNRVNSADLQDDCHAAIWVTETGSGTTVGLIGSNSNTGVAQRRIYRTSTACNDISGSAYSAPASGLIGISRSSPSSYIRRSSNSDATLNVASTGNPSFNIAIFARDFLGASSWGGRASFYSLGGNLNLALLDARLATYMSSLT
jgi:hypothetical protein